MSQRQDDVVQVRERDDIVDLRRPRIGALPEPDGANLGQRARLQGRPFRTPARGDWWVVATAPRPTRITQSCA